MFDRVLNTSLKQTQKDHVEENYFFQSIFHLMKLKYHKVIMGGTRKYAPWKILIFNLL